MVSLALAFQLGAGPALAQTATLRGRVVDEADLRPLTGATVMAGEGTPSIVTDGDGRFQMLGLEPGMVVVRVELLGYEPLMVADVVLQSSRPTYLEIRLRSRPITLAPLAVGAPLFRQPDAAPTSVQILSNQELRRTAGGLLDVSRTLLSLPGVLGGVDSRNDLLVRGGGPGENAYYLDGIRIPQINHFATQGASGGALGLVNVDFIREAEFFTGMFPVRYGDALSSVLTIENRPGTAEGVRGDFTLGATEAALTLDGPAGRSANWLFSVRRSYLQFLFEALGLPIRPDYWDAQLRFEANPTPTDRILVVGLGAVDDFGIVPPDPGGSYENIEIARRVIDNDQRSYTLGASWRRLVPHGFLTATASTSASRFAFSDQGDDGRPVLSNASTERSSQFELEADLAPVRGLRLAAGVGADRATLAARVFQRAIPGGTLPADLAWMEGVAVWKLRVFAQATRDVGARATVTAGLRADEVTGLDQGFSVSPRLSARYQVSDAISLQAAAGVFRQSPSLLSLSVREAGQPVNLGLRQLQDRQLVAGLTWNATPGLRVSLEAFSKAYSHVPLLRADPRISVSNLGGDYGFVGAEPLVGGGTGRARGIELFTQQKLLQDFYFLGAYTLSWSEFAGADGVLRPSAWDRRHALDLTGGFRPDRNWELSGRMRILSGLAATPWDMEASRASYAITGRGVPDWSRIGELRTPTYARLDVRGERHFNFTRWDMSIYLDLQNVLGRANTAGYGYTEDPASPDRIRPIEDVGFLPTFGFSIEF